MSNLRRLAAATLAMLCMAALPATVLGHVEIVESSPADGAALEAPPEEVVLTFDDELDPDASRFTVTDAAGEVAGEGEVDLKVADRNVLRGDVDTEPGGRYAVSWTVAGTDGHPIDGTLDFSVAPADAATDEAPDTALPPTRMPGAVVAAGALILTAAVAATRLRLRECPS